MQTDEQKEAIEYLELHADDLHEPTEEMQRSIWIALGYILDLEVKLNERADLAADIPVITHNAELPQFDPVYVRTLQQAYSEMVTHTASIEDENKRLTELLRGDRMVVATRINHEYTKAKGTIRELQAENEQLRAILENTRQQRDDAYSERAEAQRWQPIIDTYHDGLVEVEQDEKRLIVKFDGKPLMIYLNDVRLCRKVTP
jgi:hypothetical protein